MNGFVHTFIHPQIFSTKCVGVSPRRQAHGRPEAPQRPPTGLQPRPTPRTRLAWPRPSRSAAPARTWEVEARANGFYSHLLAPTTHLYSPPSRPPPPVERASARSSTRAQRASPAPRPVLPGTRRRKRRRGPFGPEVDPPAALAPSGRRSCRESPFARGRAQADRHQHLRHRSAIL